jgi:cytochrome c oxidase subunit 4
MVTTEAVDEKPTHPSATRYVAGWLALVVLTGVTFALSTVEMGGWSLALALVIAVTKGSIVALFFMHLWDHRGASRLVLVTAVLFVAVLSSLVVADVLTRFPLALPPR